MAVMCLLFMLCSDGFLFLFLIKSPFYVIESMEFFEVKYLLQGGL